MIPISKNENGAWVDIPVTHYKNESGTWQDVTRQVLFESEASGFQVRYFEILPGGYSSFERHEHEHCVIVQLGSGRVRLGDEWHSITKGDIVRVSSKTPHQFTAEAETLGILCIVDSIRDIPELLENQKPEQASV